MERNFYAIDDLGRRHAFTLRQEGEHLFLTLKKEAFADAKKLWALGDFTRATAGEDGYYLLPRNISMMGEFQTFFREREDITHAVARPIMSMFGLKKADVCAIVRLERTYKYSLETAVKDGVYTLSVLFDFTVNDEVYDDIRMEIVLLPETADYPDMARAERELRLFRGEIEPLSEKCKREAVEYARKYPLIRIRMGWKPSPSPIKHQTKENEPPMFVACDFARVCDIADELERQGVEGAELQLVGWHSGGHDGRFPQIFPADERLGGDAGLQAAIDYVKQKGYRISLHTNLIDATEIADNFSWDDVCIDRQGEYCQIGDYSGGYAYRVCPDSQVKNNHAHLSGLCPLGLNGIHFTDVISIVEPSECHAKDHPVNSRDSVRIMQEIMEETREKMGAFSSEGAMDFALGHLDYALYLTFGHSFGSNPVPIADRTLPFFELTYHGILLYNATSSTVNYPIKPADDRLLAILRGGKPSLYFFSRFRTGTAINWMGETDLVTTTDADLRHAVGTVGEALAEYRQAGLDRLQHVYMKDYQVRENGLEVAVYEDGTVIAGNFGDADVQYGGMTLPAGAYRVTRA